MGHDVKDLGLANKGRLRRNVGAKTLRKDLAQILSTQ